MSGKNGLFDSDDEDDVQYNPDEGDEDDEQLDQPIQTTSVPLPVPAKPAQQVTQQVKADEEEKIPTRSEGSTVPFPKPSQAKASTYKAEDDSVFSVSDPVNTGHVTYTVKGQDEDGEFEGSRRYNDFYHLRNSLVNRWPGTYVPAIPSKKAVGNKDDKYIEHRRYFLQRFLRKIALLPHLLNSDEFKLFARPSGEIEKMLLMMPKPTPQSIVEKYKINLHIDEFPDDFLVKQCKEVINEFGSFCKKVLPTLKAVREQSSKMVPTRQSQNSNYKVLMETM